MISSVWQNQRVEWSKVVLIAVEFSPVLSKRPVAVGERISKGERHDLGAAAPLPTRASSLLEQGRAGGPVESPPKLVEHMGSGSTVCRTEMPMHRLYCFSGLPCAREPWCLLARLLPWPRRAFRVSCSRPAKRCLVPLISFASISVLTRWVFTPFSSLSIFFSKSRHTSLSVG